MIFSKNCWTIQWDFLQQITIEQSKFLVKSSGHIFQLGVDLAGWGSHDEAAEGVPSAAHVGIAAHEMDGAIGEDDTGFCCIFDGVFGLALFPRNTRNTAGEMVALKVLNILDLEGLEEEVVQSQHGDGIFESEAQHEGPEEIVGPLDGGPILRLLALTNIHRFLLHVHPDLQLHVLDDSLADLLPAVLEGGHAVGGNEDGVHFEAVLLIIGLVCGLFGGFNDLFCLHC